MELEPQPDVDEDVQEQGRGHYKEWYSLSRKQQRRRSDVLWTKILLFADEEGNLRF